MTSRIRAPLLRATHPPPRRSAWMRGNDVDSDVSRSATIIHLFFRRQGSECGECSDRPHGMRVEIQDVMLCCIKPMLYDKTQ